MADERYRKLMGIEPKGEVPTHYELLGIESSVTDVAVIEEAYKAQMKKLQTNKNSKASAFLEYLKGELRTARLTLTSPERRKVYDDSLGAEAVTDFKKFVEPLMALGQVPKNLYEMMIQKGVAAGLTADQAKEIILELAKARNATIQTEAPPTAVATAPQPAALQIPDDADPSATHADPGFGDSGEHIIGTGSDEETLEDDPGSYSDERPTEPEDEVVAEAVDEGEPAFYDDAEDKTPAPLPAPRQQETVLKAPASWAPRDRPAARDPTPVPAAPEPNPLAAKIKRGGFWDMADTMQPPPKAAPSPWARGGGKPGESGRAGAGASSPWSRQPSPSESGRVGSGAGGAAIDPRISEAAARASGSAPPPRTPPPRPGQPDSVQSQRDRFRGQEQQRALIESKKKHNQGAKLARIASDLHDSLAQYFPPTNGKQTITYQINGVSFEKVFDMEHKTFRDSLTNFEAALQRTDGLGGDDVDELRARLGQNVNLVKTYLEELRQVKLKRLQPLTKSDELRMWQTFVSSKRSARLSQTIDER